MQINTNYRVRDPENIEFEDIKHLFFDVPTDEYINFFQFFTNKENLKNIGLHKTLKEFFPIVSHKNGITIEYNGYSCKQIKFNKEIYTFRYLSYASTITIDLVITVNKDTAKEKKIQHNYIINNVPIPTENRNFIINGTEKTFIKQLVKIGGVYIFKNRDGTVFMILMSATGSRAVFKSTLRHTLRFYLNSSEPFLLFQLFGFFDKEDILNYIKKYKSQANVDLFNETKNDKIKYALVFGDCFKIRITKDGIQIYNCNENFIKDYLVIRNNNFTYNKEKKIGFVKFEDIYSLIIGRINDSNLKTKQINTLTFKTNILLSQTLINKILNLFKKENNSSELYIDITIIPFLCDQNIICKSFLQGIDKKEENLNIETNVSEHTSEEEEESINDDDEFASRRESGNMDFATFDNEGYDSRIDRVTIDKEKPNIMYNINSCIRQRINSTLGSTGDDLQLTTEDFIRSLIKVNKVVIDANFKNYNYDELVYKRVKFLEEFIETIIKRCLTSIEKQIHALNITKNIEDYNNIITLFNGHKVTSAITSLLFQHPLCQYSDTLNPLSKNTHSRKASFVNLVTFDPVYNNADATVNNSFVNSLCIHETPENASVGMVNTLASCARVDSNGFIISPYFIVKEGKNTGEIIYLNPEEIKNKYVCSFIKNFHKVSKVLCRYNNEILEVSTIKINFMDISNMSSGSMSTSLIPWLSHNLPIRILMGANMQRQAVPLKYPEISIVGTGTEQLISRKSNENIYNDEDNRIVYSASSNHVLTCDENYKNFKVYHIERYKRTNMKTCEHFIVIVKPGQKLKKGDPIAFNSCFVDDKIALGQNVIVLFGTIWGHVYEDCILGSKSLLKKEKFSSLRRTIIEVKGREVAIKGKDMIGVKEIFTKDNPDEDISKSNQLDNRGIVKIGTKVKPGSILVSRVVPINKVNNIDNKNNNNILQIILGKSDLQKYKNISVYSSISGIVCSVEYFHKDTGEQESSFFQCFNETEIHILKDIITALLKHLSNDKYTYYYTRLREVTEYNEFNKILKDLKKEHIFSSDKKQFYEEIKKEFDKRIKEIDATLLLSKLCNLDNTITQIVRISIITDQVLAVGDKLCGLYGNKGVIGELMDEEDMPFLPDGTPVEIVLNPLGIPSRMNLGQIFVGMQGYSSLALKNKINAYFQTNKKEEAKKLVGQYLKFKMHMNSSLSIDEAIEIMQNGDYIILKAPAFDSISPEEVQKVLNLLGVDKNCLLRVRNGLTGLEFNRDMHVGVMQILKLNHLVKDKLSVRSTGRYKEISSTPDSSKTSNGAQKIGEMEGVALEAYGAARNVQLVYGANSDDIEGRKSLAMGIFTNKHEYDRYIPESLLLISGYLSAAHLELKFLLTGVNNMKALEEHEE